MGEHDHKWKSWGKPPSQVHWYQRDPDECPHCSYHDRSFFYQYFVGFSDNPDDRGSMYENDRAGMSTHECPQCFMVFKRHVHGPEMPIINQKMARDANYLKVPGAKEAFLRMLKEVKGNE